MRPTPVHQLQPPPQELVFNNIIFPQSCTTRAKAKLFILSTFTYNQPLEGGFLNGNMFPFSSCITRAKVKVFTLVVASMFTFSQPLEKGFHTFIQVAPHSQSLFSYHIINLNSFTILSNPLMAWEKLKLSSKIFSFLKFRTE